MDPIIFTRSIMSYIWEPYVGMLSLIMIVMTVAALLDCIVSLRNRELGSGVVFGIATVLLIFFGGFVVASEDRSAVDDDAVAAAVSERYAIETITPVGHADPEEICQSVSPDSPEYAGVTDGREIRFRVGFADCDDPSTARIIVTQTP